MRTTKPFPWAFFLLGLGSETYIHFIGYVAISELVIFFLAPIIFFQDYVLLGRHGFFKVLFFAFSFADFKAFCSA